MFEPMTNDNLRNKVLNPLPQPNGVASSRFSINNITQPITPKVKAKRSYRKSTSPKPKESSIIVNNQPSYKRFSPIPLTAALTSGENDKSLANHPFVLRHKENPVKKQLRYGLEIRPVLEKGSSLPCHHLSDCFYQALVEMEETRKTIATNPEFVKHYGPQDTWVQHIRTVNILARRRAESLEEEKKEREENIFYNVPLHKPIQASSSPSPPAAFNKSNNNGNNNCSFYNNYRNDDTLINDDYYNDAYNIEESTRDLLLRQKRGEKSEKGEKESYDEEVKETPEVTPETVETHPHTVCSTTSSNNYRNTATNSTSSASTTNVFSAPVVITPKLIPTTLFSTPGSISDRPLMNTITSPELVDDASPRPVTPMVTTPELEAAFVPFRDQIQYHSLRSDIDQLKEAFKSVNELKDVIQSLAQGKKRKLNQKGVANTEVRDTPKPKKRLVGEREMKGVVGDLPTTGRVLRSAGQSPNTRK